MIVDSDRVNVSSLMRTQGLNQRSHQPLFELRTEKPSSQATKLEPRPHVSYPIVPHHPCPKDHEDLELYGNSGDFGTIKHGDTTHTSVALPTVPGGTTL